MIDILPSFERSPRTASSSAALSFVRMRSSVHSAFPLKDTNFHRTLSYGSCLDRPMEGKIGDKREEGQKCVPSGAKMILDYHSFNPNASAFIILAFCIAASRLILRQLPR